MFFFLSVGFITDSPFEVIRFSFLEKYNNTKFFYRFACFAGSGAIVLRTALKKAREI